MKAVYAFVMCLGLLNYGPLFAQDTPKGEKDKDKPAPTAERKEGDRKEADRPAAERPPPPRREGERADQPRREGDRPAPPPREGDGPRPPRDGEGRPFPPGPGGREFNIRLPDGRDGPPRGRGPEGPGGSGFFPQDDPEMLEIMKKDQDLERSTFELSNRLRMAPQGEREKIKTELTEVVRKHFDIRQERRELQVKRMEEELKRLKEQVESRTKSRDDIIRRRITELTGDPGDAGF